MLERLAEPPGVHRLRHQLLGRQPAARTTGSCDVCGGEVVQRADDTPEAIRKRLDLYEQRDRARSSPGTTSSGLLAEVDGLGTADEVTPRLIDAIDARRHS